MSIEREIILKVIKLMFIYKFTDMQRNIICNFRRFEKMLMEPSADSLCLCGSGVKYKHCCTGGEFREMKPLGFQARLHLASGDLKEAEICSRKVITLYSRCHLTNTVPAISGKSEDEVFDLIKMDVEALAECVNSLCRIMRLRDKSSELLKNLENLRININSRMWQKKITYFQVRSKTMNMGSKILAHEAEIFEPIAEESDVAIIALYLELKGGSLELDEQLSLLTAALENSTSDFDKMYFGFRRAGCLFLLGSRNRCITGLEEIDTVYGTKERLEEQNLTYKTVYANAISFLADLKQSGPLKKKALGVFLEISEDGSLENQELASIYYNIGNCLFHKAMFEDAVKYFKKSYLLEPKDIVLVYQSLALMDNNDPSCVDLIKSVDVTSLDPNEFFDFAVNFSRISIYSKDPEMIKEAISYLKRLDDQEAVFEKQKSQLLMEMTDIILEGVSETKLQRVMRLLGKLFSASNRYIMLEPNICGIGLNGNNIIEDLTNGQVSSASVSQKSAKTKK